MLLSCLKHLKTFSLTEHALALFSPCRCLEWASIWKRLYSVGRWCGTGACWRRATACVTAPRVTPTPSWPSTSSPMTPSTSTGPVWWEAAWTYWPDGDISWQCPRLLPQASSHQLMRVWSLEFPLVRSHDQITFYFKSGITPVGPHPLPASDGLMFQQTDIWRGGLNKVYHPLAACLGSCYKKLLRIQSFHIRLKVTLAILWTTLNNPAGSDPNLY